MTNCAPKIAPKIGAVAGELETAGQLSTIVD
jgi:hypothetical protein